MRAVAVPMLCAMVHSNVRGRAALHAADGASVFLRLLPDPLYTVCPRAGFNLACPPIMVP